MTLELFLICAMSLPGANFTRPAIISWHAAKSEEDGLKNWIRKNNPEAEIFITPRGDADRLKGYGFEKLPFTYKDKEIWIQRKPKSDQKCLTTAA